MRRTILLTLLLLTALAVRAQESVLADMEPFLNVADLLPDNVEVQGATQGFAIHGRYGFSMHDKGQCVIIDMRRREFVSTYVMEGNTGHCNNASFGVERYSSSSEFPLLYVTECRGQRACYVNDVTLEGSRLVQTIYYDGEEITGPADWAVDARTGRIYLYCTIGTLRWLKAFPLPALADSDARGEVHLSLQMPLLQCLPARSPSRRVAISTVVISFFLRVFRRVLHVCIRPTSSLPKRLHPSTSQIWALSPRAWPLRVAGFISHSILRAMCAAM